MLAIKAILNEDKIKFIDEKPIYKKNASVIVTFLDDRYNTETDNLITERQLKLLRNGFNMGKIKYSSREELYER